jgi:hypothetical protein
MNCRAFAVAFVLGLLCELALAPGSGAAEPEHRQGDDSRPRPVRPPASALPQKVLKVDERSITVKPAMTFDDGPQPVEETLRIDKERTKVLVFEEKEKQQDENGTTRTRGTFRPSTLADLKPGQTVRYRAQDGLASEIRIMPKVPTRGESRRPAGHDEPAEHKK